MTTHVLAILALAAACGAWWIVQRLAGRTVDGCCGLRSGPERDCESCPERKKGIGAAGGAVLVVALALHGLGCGGSSRAQPSRHSGERMLMGTRFAIELVADDAGAAQAAIAAAFDEVARVEELLSEWKETSEISEVNRQAGVAPVRVGPEMLEVARASVVMAERTGGAFDPTFAACGGAWSFRDRRIPSDEELRACTELVDWRALGIDTDASTLFLPRKGMKIGIAGIGKGYGVDRAAAVLEQRGYHDYFVDGGGDVRLSGHSWRVGIAHPRKPGHLLGRLEVSGGSIVTSGDYYRYFEVDGVRYHHVLDPATGRPARGCTGVTVMGPDATTADALATGLFVLGPERGLALVEGLPGVEALYVLPDMSVRRSSGFPAISPPA